MAPKCPISCAQNEIFEVTVELAQENASKQGVQKTDLNEVAELYGNAVVPGKAPPPGERPELNSGKA